MKKFIFKIGIYGILLALGMELLVRIFHLHTERPERYLDELQVEKWVPNQTGLSVTGNRKQNVGRYRINQIGFNSVYDTYTPQEDELDVALVGDSFIEGFHQDYDRSLGQKVERLLDNKVKVFEYGYAGYDLADQLHLIQAYDSVFKKIDYTVIYMRFTDDLTRDSYAVSDRLSFNTPVNRIMKEIKTVVYLKDVGLFDPITQTMGSLMSLIKGGAKPGNTAKRSQEEINGIRLENFEKLIAEYGYDKDKNILLLDSRLCSEEFLDYLKKNGFKTLDFSKTLEASETPTDLIYDQHWNDHGRELLAQLIADYVKSKR